MQVYSPPKDLEALKDLPGIFINHRDYSQIWVIGSFAIGAAGSVQFEVFVKEHQDAWLLATSIRSSSLRFELNRPNIDKA